MLIITPKQQAIGTRALQDRFLKRVQVHLEETSQVLGGASDIDFRPDQAMERLRSEMDLLISSGIEYGQDIVIAIEYFELFHVDKDCDEAVRILRSDASSISKLDRLFELRERTIIG